MVKNAAAGYVENMGHENVESSRKQADSCAPRSLHVCLRLSEKRAKKIITPVMQAINNQIDLPQDDLISFSAIFCNRPRSGRESDEQRRTFLKVYQSDQSNFKDLPGRPVENS